MTQEHVSASKKHSAYTHGKTEVGK